MSTFSSNITQKIGGGGSFAVTTASSGSNTLVTTGANEYAKVMIAGELTINNSGINPSGLSLSVGGNVIRSFSFTGTGLKGSLHNQRDPDASGSGEGVHMFEVLVPPSSTLVLTRTVGSGSVVTLAVRGSYVLFTNTP